MTVLSRNHFRGGAKTLRATMVAALTLATSASAAVASAAAPEKLPPAPRLVVIGATARSSGEIIWQALATGWRVTAVARDPGRIDLRHERLEIRQGDVMDRASLEAAMNGDEVVVSMVGPRVDPLQEAPPTSLLSSGTANIVAAMKARGNRRLIVASSTGVENEPPAVKPPATDPGSAWLWNSRHIYADMRSMERVVRDSGLDYLILRPGFMVPGPPRNDLELAIDRNSPKGRMITYADFAAFVVGEAARPAHRGQAVGLYSARQLAWGVNADLNRMAQQSQAAAGAAPANQGTSAATGGRSAAESPAPAIAPAPAPASRGDALRGRGLAETCVPCHGAAGISESPAFPIIAGQQFDYLVGAMLAYLSGTRQDSIMGGSIRTLSRGEIEDLAAYYSTLRGLGTAATPAGAAGATALAGPSTPGAAPGAPTGAPAGAPPGGALAAAQAAAEAARALQPPAARASQRGRDPDAAERRACAVAASRATAVGVSATAALADRDGDGDGVPDRDDAAPADAAQFALDADRDGFLAICNAAQLRAIGRGGDALLQRNFELVADLDLAGAAIVPIGNCGPANNCMISRDRFAYAAHFDGNGHTIRGLRLALPEAGGVGLFGTLGRTGAVTRLALRDAEVSGANGTGLLVGASFGVIADCDVQGTVRGRVAIGGITGGNAGRVLRSRADVRVEAVAAAGGLVGDMNGTVESSVARVTMNGGKGAGGLVGLSTYGSIIDSRASGTVSGIDNVGGLVGLNTDALLEGSEADVVVQGSGTNAGGAIGYSAQSVVRNVVARGEVKGGNAVGGLVGRNRGAVLNAYATGRVGGDSAVGGLVGDNAGGTLRGAYWDSTRSGVTTGAGLARSSEQLYALTAAQALWEGADQRCRGDSVAVADRLSAREGARARETWIFNTGRDYPRLGCLPGEDSP